MGRVPPAIRTFIAAIRLEVPLDRAILFGSRARGDHLVDSDYDLILVSEAFAGVAFTDRPNRLSRHWCHPESLDLFCYTPDEFTRKSQEIGTVQDAVREGLDVLAEAPEGRPQGSAGWRI